MEKQRPHRRAPTAAPVDAAHHQIRPTPDRRPRPAGLAGGHQVVAEKLDRPQRGRGSEISNRRFRFSDRGLHHPPGHPLRRDLHGARPRASFRRPNHHRRTSGSRRKLSEKHLVQVRHGPRRSQQGQIRSFHRGLRHQSRQQRAHPDLDRRLRHDGLRHRCHHGRPGTRRAGFRVCGQIRAPDGPSGRPKECRRPAHIKECGRLAYIKECGRPAHIKECRRPAHINPLPLPRPHHPHPSPSLRPLAALAAAGQALLRHLASRR